MILMDGAQRARLLTHWPFRHSCEWYVLCDDTGGSQFIQKSFWVSRALVTETQEASSWIYDRMDQLASQGDGPARELADQWVRSPEAQRRAYNQIFSGDVFVFQGWDGEGLTHVIAVSRIPLKRNRNLELVKELGWRTDGDAN